jgi:FKBP-type peptidyl-prolyl cis-trans isomerase SlyD
VILYGESKDGQSVQAIVRRIDGKAVIINYNHPLAGKNLSFNVKLAKVREAIEREINSGALEHKCCDEYSYDAGCCCSC